MNGDDTTAFWSSLLRSVDVLLWLLPVLMCWIALRTVGMSAWVALGLTVLARLVVRFAPVPRTADGLFTGFVEPAGVITGLRLYGDYGDVRWLALLRKAPRLPLITITVDMPDDGLQRQVLSRGGRVVGARLEGGNLIVRSEEELERQSRFFDE